MKGFLSFFLLTFSTLIFSQGVQFNKLLSENPDEEIVTCIPNTDEHRRLLVEDHVTLKYETDSFLFINASPRWLNLKKESNELKQFYFEFAPPQLLSDTAIVIHRVDSVHQGLGNLPKGYTGKGVLIGLVDSGIDYRHPDFKDVHGKTRVLKYWDQTLSGPGAPMPYNYGIEYDSSVLNSTVIPSDLSNSIHGSSVSGMAVSNGFANGSNKGVAPDADIVMVHTNFNRANWTLTVADAIDYIFNIADSYGLSAVVNLSVGTYLGSHDGNDPASQMIEDLLDQKPGRIVVAAAGNSGSFGNYHLSGRASLDTSFTWFLNNPNSAVGTNKIYFDFWMQNADAPNLFFGFGADNPANFELRGQSKFHQINSDMLVFPLRDTIYNPSGIIIATTEVYREVLGESFHMEVLFNRIDTTNYYYRFSTFGTAPFDLWSGTAINLNAMVENIPSTAQMPKIIDYQLPDANQSIVSSWNCSEKVISVGNFRNRLTYVNKNGTNYIAGSPSASVGQLSLNSSKGPSRLKVIKPDISAAGDISLGAGSLAFLGNPANNGSIDSGGWHIRNGGTSMASPVVAGIAALFLERCPGANYEQFRNLVHNKAFRDTYTGSQPNNAYGYGKVNGYGIVNGATNSPSPVIYQNGIVLISDPQPNYQWMKNGLELPNETSQSLAIFPPNASYQVYTLDNSGCYNYSKEYESVLKIKTLNFNQNTIAPNPTSDFLVWKGNDYVVDYQCFTNDGKRVEIQLSGNRFDVSTLVEGLYYLQINTQDEFHSIKFVRTSN
ncbi:MAG: S8 family peptidase [Bacteroidetes bacterium]|nr:S8 family peptidase [Bacteroidota bacterium]